MSSNNDITEIREKALSDIAAAPEKIKESPYGDGWLVKIKMSDAGEVGALLKAADYKGIIAE